LLDQLKQLWNGELAWHRTATSLLQFSQGLIR
jgi:hypothetical protein